MPLEKVLAKKKAVLSKDTMNWDLKTTAGLLHEVLQKTGLCYPGQKDNSVCTFFCDGEVCFIHAFLGIKESHSSSFPMNLCCKIITFVSNPKIFKFSYR